MRGIVIVIDRRGLGRIAMQRMDAARIVILRRGWRRLLPDGALNPGGRTRRGSLVGLRRRLIALGLIVIGLIVIGLIAIVRRAASDRLRMRLQRQVGPSDGAKRIGLTDQARELRERIAVGFGGRVRSAAAIVVV